MVHRRFHWSQIAGEKFVKAWTAGQSETTGNVLNYRVLEMHFPVKGYKLLFVRAFHIERRWGRAFLPLFSSASLLKQRNCTILQLWGNFYWWGTRRNGIFIIESISARWPSRWSRINFAIITYLVYFSEEKASKCLMLKRTKRSEVCRLSHFYFADRSKRRTINNESIYNWFVLAWWGNINMATMAPTNVQ